MKDGVWVSLAIVASMALGLPSVAQKNKTRTIDGAQIYKQYCQSCHAGGGNSVKPGLPVAGSKKLVTLATFKSYLSAPPRHMPFYKNLTGDQQMLEALYQYCKKLPKPTQQASRRHLLPM